jgi:esterase/lipase
MKEWRRKVYFEALNTRTNQMMHQNVSILDDIEKNRETGLNIQNAVEKLNCPLLIAHGVQDMAVPISEAEQLYEWSNKSKTELFKIYSAGHTFDIVHPFSGTTDKFEELLDKTTHFFVNNL